MNHHPSERTVASMNVAELVNLIRQTIREELADLFGVKSESELTPMQPTTFDIDEIISKMQATGKYSKKFLASLRKGMERSQSFKRQQTRAAS